jgi:alkylation response protein AidB-like acyl-CoA dehydrogenase
MDFTVSEEQSMLADSVAKFIDNDYDFESRQKAADSDLGYSEELWNTFAELGWTAVPFDEDDGGLGGGSIEMMLMMEQFGRGLLVEPFLANIVLAGGVLRRVASDEQKVRWLAGIISGETQATLAFAEPQARFDINNVATSATRDGDGYVISGNKALVLNGGSADLIIVPARTHGKQSDQDGITLFAVAADSAGIEVRPYKTVDGHQAAEIEFNKVSVDRISVLGEVGNGYSTLQEVVDEATLAVCAEAVGIIRTLQDKTVEYVKNRVQFGVPIGSFQALQHRLVETLMECEQSKSLLLWSAMVNNSSGADAKKSIHALKHQIGTAGVNVAKEAVQMHGGMGVTWELDIAHFFKRLTAIDMLFGNADYHLDKYIKLTA